METIFETYPVCRPYRRNAGFIEFAEDWNFEIDGKKIWIPKDYFFDGASIPRIFWAIIGSPFEPDFWAGAGAHDWLYLTHGRTRAEADDVLFQLLLRAGVGLWRARVIWAAVRSCGWPSWHNTEADIQEIRDILIELFNRPDFDKFAV